LEQIPDKSKPPSTSYRETFRRHRKLFCVPMILGAVAAAAVLFTSTKTYTSTASLWVDTAPPLASSIGGAVPVLTTPPAAAEQGILNELLTTDAFASSVVKSSSLGKSLRSAASIQAAGSALLENGQVVPVVAGQQILKIKYSGPSAAITQSVLGGIVAQLQSYNDDLTAQHDQAAVAYDTKQVNIAKTALQTARDNVNAYVAKHPGVTQSDPILVSLVAAENTAVTQLGQATTTLNQATGTLNEGGWTIQVVDPPSPAGSVALGKKKMLEVILGGAFGGLLVSFLVVVALTPAKKEAWEDELPIGKPFGPHVPSARPLSGQSPPTAGGQLGSRLLSRGERRFTVHNAAEKLEDR
jgi:uncharacterized protein involved in exopolysaccharide biosynthesis